MEIGCWGTAPVIEQHPCSSRLDRGTRRRTSRYAPGVGTVIFRKKLTSTPVYEASIRPATPPGDNNQDSRYAARGFYNDRARKPAQIRGRSLRRSVPTRSFAQAKGSKHPRLANGKPLTINPDVVPLAERPKLCWSGSEAELIYASPKR